MAKAKLSLFLIQFKKNLQVKREDGIGASVTTSDDIRIVWATDSQEAVRKLLEEYKNPAAGYAYTLTNLVVSEAIQ